MLRQKENGKYLYGRVFAERSWRARRGMELPVYESEINVKEKIRGPFIKLMSAL